MFLGPWRKNEPWEMKEKTLIYSFSEESYIEYINKIYLEKQLNMKAFPW